MSASVEINQLHNILSLNCYAYARDIIIITQKKVIKEDHARLLR